MNESREQRSHLPAWTLLVVVAVFGYMLSSGPVLASGFWLREATGWNGWYAVMWLYYPLLAWGHWQALDAYIEWWVDLFGTVGPG